MGQADVGFLTFIELDGDDCVRRAPDRGWSCGPLIETGVGGWPMDAFVAYTVFGVVMGAGYAVAASGLVLTYTTSRVFNVAHGAVGMVMAFAYWELSTGIGLPAPAALLLVLGVIAPATGAVIERVMMRRLADAPVGVRAELAPMLGWHGAAHTPYVIEQNSYLISGGLFGLGLVFVGGLVFFGGWLARIAADNRDAVRRITRSLDAPAAAERRRPAALVATPKGAMAHRDDCPGAGPRRPVDPWAGRGRRVPSLRRVSLTAEVHVVAVSIRTNPAHDSDLGGREVGHLPIGELEVVFAAADLAGGQHDLEDEVEVVLVGASSRWACSTTPITGAMCARVS